MCAGPVVPLSAIVTLYRIFQLRSRNRVYVDFCCIFLDSTRRITFKVSIVKAIWCMRSFQMR